MFPGVLKVVQNPPSNHDNLGLTCKGSAEIRAASFRLRPSEACVATALGVEALEIENRRRASSASDVPTDRRKCDAHGDADGVEAGARRVLAISDLECLIGVRTGHAQRVGRDAGVGIGSEIERHNDWVVRAVVVARRRGRDARDCRGATGFNVPTPAAILGYRPNIEPIGLDARSITGAVCRWSGAVLAGSGECCHEHACTDHQGPIPSRAQLALVCDVDGPDVLHDVKVATAARLSVVTSNRRDGT